MRDFIARVISGQENSFGAYILRPLLRIAAFFYGLAAGFRNYLYDRSILRPANLGKPVISVGNLTWGGVGKTPFVLMTAGYFYKKGFRPCVLTRGYMNEIPGKPVQSDEVMMMRRILPDVPVGVGKDRAAAGRRILSEKAVDIFILDDGFQHRKVKRDLDIVLIDATQPFGNGCLVPAGILRESRESLRRSPVIIITKTDFDLNAARILEERLGQINPDAVIAWANHVPTGLEDIRKGRREKVAFLRGRKVCAFCGLGDPKGFLGTLRSLGARVDCEIIYADHHDYTRSDIDSILSKARQEGIEDIITTAKDAVKVFEFREMFQNHPCRVLNIELELGKGKEKVLERMDSLLGG